MGTAVLYSTTAQWSVRSAFPAGPTVIQLRGEVDAEVAPALESCVIGGLEQGSDVVIDLTAVTLLDCACQGVLVRAHCRAQVLGLLLTLAGATAQVERTLAATGVDAVLRITAGVGQAVAESRQHALEQVWPERLRRRRRRVTPARAWRRLLRRRPADSR
jgi:anti-sigma B factor antagonist